ncbi:hypothetical protein IT157_07095 [bacterium]|nr:hypothetical protein [bacterium]
MHTEPLTQDTRRRNRKVVYTLVAGVLLFVTFSLIYLANYGVNFQRHGFH